MKYRLYVFTICASILSMSNVYGGIPGKCPIVLEDWDGSELEGWSLDPNYADKLKAKKEEDHNIGYRPYTFLNAWLYYPAESKNKPAVCHYNYEGKRSNQLSLIIKDKNTDNAHFAPNEFVHPGSNGQGIHCKQPAAIDDCVFEDGPAVAK